MQFIHNELITPEENAEQERHIDMTPAQEFDETEKWLKEQDEQDENDEREMAEMEKETAEFLANNPEPEEEEEEEEEDGPEVELDFATTNA